MKRKLLLLAIGLLAVGGLAVWTFEKDSDSASSMPAVSDEELTQRMADRHGAAPTAQPTPVILDPNRAVRLAIGNLGLPEEEANRQAADLAVAELKGAKGLELVERQSLDLALRELNLSLAGLVRAQDAVRVGKLVRADWFLLGSVFKFNGSNAIVVRVVDARTGILREAGVFAADGGTTRLAGNLAGFVRQCRQNAAEAKVPTYLAVGGFEDLSLNNRQASLPSQLRSYLIAAYQGTNVTLLERECANTLLQEVRLDLAGLTEEAGTNTTAMQAAYWMVDGFYQSYETTNLQVELVLNVRRLFGRNQQIELREKPGEPLFRSVKSAIDQVMEKNKASLVFSRQTEVRALFDNGRSLARIGDSDYLDFIWAHYEGYSSRSGSEMARRVRNTEEAVRAFETVLLLDPSNREARIYLATCFRKTLINRIDEARDYYREIINSPVEDRWPQVAREALLHSLEGADPDARRQWFEKAAQATTNLSAMEFYQANAKRAAEDSTIQSGGSKGAEELAEVRLFETIKSFDNVIYGRSGTASFAVGMDDYAEVIGANRALVAGRLAELFPKMKAQFPDAAPYLLATIVTFQVDTNAAIIAEFERTLEACVAEPDKLPNKGTTFWSHIRSGVYEWALKQKRNDLAARILESISQAALIDPAARMSLGGDGDKIALAYAYLAAQRWKDALTVFETFTNRPIETGGEGPWGPAFTVVLPSKQAAVCREKLGLPAVIDPREFDLGEPCLHPHSRKTYYDTVTFLTAADGLWIGLNDHVMQVDFNLRTNFMVQLSPSVSAPVSTLCLGESTVWIGTAGGGLFELDKATRKIRHLVEQDGLLMNYISALHLAGDTLWIGYGNESAGGLGRLDLKTRRFISFGASLSTKGIQGGPPSARVAAMRTDSTGDLWFTMHSSVLSRYSSTQDVWETQPNQRNTRVSCYTMDGERLVQALDIAQLELTIEPVPRRGQTNLVAKVTRV